ncbi:uncharacterized protein LOC123402764 isoform X3 [Hordeum vulgare subsp. vulgare]|uniref:uncharacterized protein LOC123402764 isoform X3 n=1 Tax=Hordeum vulgare subsp. vulgare TaxID=112509 RepID=UPI001D1A4118|nr:uncharacterized protein LOC123402764 isoform X3 [Hordeum vulgare subsp. vulgare]
MLKILQQATVIANSTNFRVQSYYGDGKNPRDHGDWETEMGESEVRFARHSPCRLITMIFQLGKCCRELFSVTTASTPTVGRRAAVPGQHPVPEEGATAGKEVFRDTDLSSHSEDDDELKHLKRTVRSWV